MSYYEDASISHDITTDAGFRAWAQKIHDGLSAVGLVQTSDTGQINLSTVTTPGSNSTFGGYEIWRFNDAHQGAEPLYMKIEYGRGAAASRPGLRVTMGRGSDGSGGLTTASTALTGTPGVNPSGTGLINIVHVADALAINFVTDNTVGPSTTRNALFVVERCRDEDDAVVAGTAIFFQAAGSTFGGNSELRSTTFKGGVWTATEGSGGNNLQAGPGSELLSGKAVAGTYVPIKVPAAPIKSVIILNPNGGESPYYPASAGDSGVVNGRTYKCYSVNPAVTVKDWQGGTLMQMTFALLHE